MAAPRFIAASTGSTDSTGAWTATCHAPGAAGRIIILQILVDGVSAGAPTITSATNIENLAGTDNAWTSIGTFDVGSAAAAKQQLYIGRSLSTTAPTATGGNTGGDDLYWRFYEFAGASTGTLLSTVIENTTAGNTTHSEATSATASDAAVVSAGPDRLGLNFEAVNDDNVIAVFTGQTGGTWVRAATYAESSGTDGAIALQYSSLGLIQNTTGSAFFIGQSSANIGGIAQSFQLAVAASVSSVEVYLTKTGTPTDDITLELRADSSGSPGTVLASATKTSASLTSAAFNEFVFSYVDLGASTLYWLVLRRTGSADASHYWSASFAGSGT